MNKTTNTTGVIAAAAQQKPAAPTENKPRTPAQALNSLLNGTAIQQTLKSTLKENSGAFVTSVMNLFNNDNMLQQCEPKLVLGEALKAAALKLPVEKQLGFAYIIPYKSKIKDKNGNYTQTVVLPQFQLGYKGYIQLAMRTGAYRYINADRVYEGELKSADKLTGAIDLTGEKTSDKVIGYFAYIETLNGFSKTFYWTKERVTAHASRYSKSYKSTNSIWKENFDEMAIKTVLRNLLSHYGVMSVEMSRAMSDEEISAERPEIPSDSGEIIVDDTTLPDEETPEIEPQSASEGNEDYPFPTE